MSATDLDFSNGNGLVPCIVQDATTSRVLMVGFMNEEAYQKTLKEKLVTFYSRSKKRLWTKGETSGNALAVVDVIPDCDKDALLVKVKPRGPVCHTGADTCFSEINSRWNLDSLEAVIADRKMNPVPGSYTNTLFEGGIGKIAQKVGEEAVEFALEAKDNDREAFLGEAADLMYHYLVLLSAKNTTFGDVVQILESRHGKR